ncbi:unnamed protein product, partial [Vitis vinifera]
MILLFRPIMEADSSKICTSLVNEKKSIYFYLVFWLNFFDSSIFNLNSYLIALLLMFLNSQITIHPSIFLLYI